MHRSSIIAVFPKFKMAAGDILFFIQKSWLSPPALSALDCRYASSYHIRSGACHIGKFLLKVPESFRNKSFENLCTRKFYANIFFSKQWHRRSVVYKESRCEPIGALRLQKFFCRIEMVLSCESYFRRHVTLESSLYRVLSLITFERKLFNVMCRPKNASIHGVDIALWWNSKWRPSPSWFWSDGIFDHMIQLRLLFCTFSTKICAESLNTRRSYGCFSKI